MPHRWKNPILAMLGFTVFSSTYGLDPGLRRDDGE
jgi:hypothetical protein